jgi:hypothetical protein
VKKFRIEFIDYNGKVRSEQWVTADYYEIELGHGNAVVHFRGENRKLASFHSSDEFIIREVAE